MISLTLNLRFQNARDEAPQRAASMPATIMARMNIQPGASRRQHRGEHHRAGAKGAHEELPFGADVPQLHAEGDGAGQADQDERGGLDQRIRDSTPRLPKEALAMCA